MFAIVIFFSILKLIILVYGGMCVMFRKVFVIESWENSDSFGILEFFNFRFCFENHPFARIIVV